MRTFSKSIWGKADPSAVTIIVGGLAFFFVAVIALAVNDLFFVADIPMYWALVYFGLVFIVAENKKIAVGLKKYFLHFAYEPGAGPWFLALGCVVISFVCMVFNRRALKENLGATDIFLVSALAISAIISVTLYIVHKILIRKKITILNLNYDQIALIYYADKNKAITLYEKPLWGKFPYSIIQLPNSWSKYGDIFEGKIRFLWKHEEVSNRTVVIPVTIKFSFSGPFQAQDFNSFLPIQLSPEPINLADEIEKMFLDSVFPERAVIFIDLQNYLHDRIPEKMFMDHLLDESNNFPNHLFSNAEKITITFEGPKIAFERRIIYEGKD